MQGGEGGGGDRGVEVSYLTSREFDGDLDNKGR